jgi:hypothetical protein
LKFGQITRPESALPAMPCANEQQNNLAFARDPHEQAQLRRRSHRALMLIAAILLIITALSGSIDGLMPCWRITSMPSDCSSSTRATSR